MNVCKWQPKIVKLYDGREVLNNSQEWLQECGARYILNQDGIEGRRSLLAAIEKRNGKNAREELEARAMTLWRSGYRPK